jgi:hypothetical protein
VKPQRKQPDDQTSLITSRAIQEIQGMGAGCLLTTNEDELCDRLCTKYQKQYSLAGETPYDTEQQRRLLEESIRFNLVKRKANFFSGMRKRETANIKNRRAANS